MSWGEIELWFGQSNQIKCESTLNEHKEEELFKWTNITKSNFSVFFTLRTSHGQTDFWDTGGCVRVAAWQKSRPSRALSPRSLPQPLRPRGAPFILPQAGSPSDTILSRQALRRRHAQTSLSTPPGTAAPPADREMRYREDEGDSRLLFLYWETHKVLFWSLRVVLYFLVI